MVSQLKVRTLMSTHPERQGPAPAAPSLEIVLQQNRCNVSLSLGTGAHTPVFLTTSGTPVIFENSNAATTSSGPRTSSCGTDGKQKGQAKGWLTHEMRGDVPEVASVGRGCGFRVGGGGEVEQTLLSGGLARLPLRPRVCASLVRARLCVVVIKSAFDPQSSCTAYSRSGTVPAGASEAWRRHIR